MGISLPSLKDMIRHSTRATHPLARRRWQDYLFVMEGNQITSIIKEHPVVDYGVVDEGKHFKCWHCHDTGKQVVYDECTSCLGEGCDRCDGTGEVLRHIPCQSCQPSKRAVR